MGLQIFATGVNITTSATSAGATIPLTSSGSVPRYVRVSVTAAANIRIGTGAQTAVATDTLVMPSDSITLSTNGCTNIAAIQLSAPGTVNVVPVEDI
jgi:hypothetical protein